MLGYSVQALLDWARQLAWGAHVVLQCLTAHLAEDKPARRVPLANGHAVLHCSRSPPQFAVLQVSLPLFATLGTTAVAMRLSFSAFQLLAAVLALLGHYHHT